MCLGCIELIIELSGEVALAGSVPWRLGVGRWALRWRWGCAMWAIVGSARAVRLSGERTVH